MRVVWWLTLLMLAGLTVPVAARLTGFEWGPLVWAVALMPWVTFASVVALAMALAVRSWPLVGVAAAITALGVAWLAPLYVGSGDADEPVLTVATVNLGFGAGDADAVVTLVRDHDVDILSLQEVTPESLIALERAGLDDVLAFSEVLSDPGFKGTGLWSRHELTDAVSLDGYVSHAIRAQVQTDAGPLTVYAVHPAAPGPRVHTAWDRDLALLASELDAATGPVVVAGDFNATRDHAPFRHLASLGYIDAADQAGAGFRPTFPQDRLPVALVAIDHVMVRDAPLRAVEFTTVAVDGADHRALVVAYAAQ